MITVASTTITTTLPSISTSATTEETRKRKIKKKRGRPKHGLFKAAEDGVLKPLENWILKRGTSANIFATKKDRMGDKVGWAPLHFAAGEGHLEVTRFLLDNGAMVNLFSTQAVKNGYSYTPLFLASMKGHVNVMKLLLERGADIGKGDDISGASPLAAAALNDSLQAVAAVVIVLIVGLVVVVVVTKTRYVIYSRFKY